MKQIKIKGLELTAEWDEGRDPKDQGVELIDAINEILESFAHPAYGNPQLAYNYGELEPEVEEVEDPEEEE